MTDTSSGNELQTRDRLLVAAGELFAEHGFRAVTVREICRKAGVNVAAVSYYFAGKRDLYEAVLQRYCCGTLPTVPPALPEASPRERLRYFVHHFLHGLLVSDGPGWQGRLMAREIVEPTSLEAIVEQSIRPRHEFLAEIIRELLGGEPDEVVVRRCVFSVISQCLFYFHGQHVVRILVPHWPWDAAGIEALAEHISAFSLAAIEGLAAAAALSYDPSPARSPT